MAGSGEQAGPRLATVLEGLALQGLTGVLEIDGNPGGAIYLGKGHVTFARAAWSPDLVARLRAVLPPSAKAGELLPGADRADRDLGAPLVARGYLSADQLHAILRSIVIDAVMVLTVPLAEAAFITRIRFEPAKRHWAESFCRLPVRLVRAEALRRAERMAAFDVAGTSVLERRDLTSSGSVLGPDQRAIVRRISGAEHPASMPSRRPGASISESRGGAARDSSAEGPGLTGASPFAPVPPESLVRVLDGLKKLS